MKRLLIAAATLLAGCVTVPPTPQPAIAEAGLRATIATLASDDFEGRMAGTPGETKTINYIAERFLAAGLTSGARGSVPFLDPFVIVAKPQPKPSGSSPPSAQAEFKAHMARLGNFTSHNVIGVVRGRHPDGRAVLLMAHWDHLGICAPRAKDKICNGAIDNASGVAAIIAVAERVAKMSLDRDVGFVVTGAEEWGLLGAQAFANRPPLPLASIVAGFNLDTIAIAPAGAKVAIVAPPHARLEPMVRQAAAALGRAWDGDHEADNFLRRQDGWPLAERGVPMVMAGGSFSDLALLTAFLKSDYHQPSDELRPGTGLGGATDDANLHVELVRRAASRRLGVKPPRFPQLGH